MTREELLEIKDYILESFEEYSSKGGIMDYALPRLLEEYGHDEGEIGLEDIVKDYVLAEIIIDNRPLSDEEREYFMEAFPYVDEYKSELQEIMDEEEYGEFQRVIDSITYLHYYQ